MPVLVQILLSHPPEQIRKTHGRENVMGLHAVVPVISPKLKELRQILVPGIQINRRSALAHAQLIHCHSRIIHQLNPADYASGCPLKAPDPASRSPDLSEIQAHAPAEFADLGKVVHTSVNSFQTVGHSVNKTAGKLMIRLPGIGQGGSGHGYLHPAEHIVKPAHPFYPARLIFLHGQVQGNAQIHFLGRL